MLQADDLYYFNEGRALRLFDRLGAHLLPEGGVHFAVWAPDAQSVCVIGDFNGWQKQVHTLSPCGSSGVWAGSVREAEQGHIYKYAIQAKNGAWLEKADPFAFCTETPPRTGSVIRDLSYKWGDAEWMGQRGYRQNRDAPVSIYEVHLGSWRYNADENRPLSYAELGEQLVAYVKEMGFTHVEFLPVMEHPYAGSWGYQLTGYFAPSRRYGDPQDFMRLVDLLHQAGIGVILDWVPSHFAVDPHGLSRFDGTALYEHADPRQGYHPDWGCYIFNFSRHEVRSFLISNALFWMEYYHVDALRVDAVASMLYLDYSRKEGEWIPNQYGGRENLAAVQFLQELNMAVYSRYPGVEVIAEESTAWGRVSRPVYCGGLGFGYKWDMGWMHDTLNYFRHDPVHRSHHQNHITFRAIYAYSENFVMPLSHDEVVHGKGSMIAKMPGDDWQKFANLRCLYTYLYAMPGKKLLFMGSEFAQRDEWSHARSLDWHLLQYAPHQQVQSLVRKLNEVYFREAALHQDCDPNGFCWIDASDNAQSVISFLRRQKEGPELVLCAFNFTPMPRQGYRLGVPARGEWEEIFSSDHGEFGGAGFRNGMLETEEIPAHGHEVSLSLTLPPLGGIMLRHRQLTQS